MRFSRISLRAFLVLCIAVGVGIGLWVRHWSMRHDIVFAVRSVGDHVVEASVKEFATGRRELVYAIVFTPGSRSVAQTNLSPSPDLLQAADVVMLPEGVFLGGKPVDLDGGGNCFVYMHEPPTLIPVIGDNGPIMLNAAQFARLETTEEWRQFIKPEAERAWISNDIKRRRQLGIATP